MREVLAAGSNVDLDVGIVVHKDLSDGHSAAWYSTPRPCARRSDPGAGRRHPPRCPRRQPPAAGPLSADRAYAGLAARLGEVLLPPGHAQLGDLDERARRWQAKARRGGPGALWTLVARLAPVR